MPRVIPLLLALVLLSSRATAQAAAAPADSTFYSVSYVEVTPLSRSATSAALREYRDAIRRDNDNIRFELFEQVDRPGHFAIVETWRSQSTFDARAAARTELANAVQAVRVSGWDRRPYKTLSVSSGSAEAGCRAVVVITHVDVWPDSDVAVTLKRLADASRLEKGNVRFDILQHTMRANHFTVIETWQNQKALGTHAGTTLVRRYRDDLHPLLGSPLDERLFRTLDCGGQ